jgi:transaldolase
MTRIFADGISISSLQKYTSNPMIQGYTTNPTLIRQLGVTDYLGYVRDFLELVPDKSVSVEILTTDDDASIIREAKLLASLGANACIKVPVTDIMGRMLGGPITALASEGLSLNVTAITTKSQIEQASSWLENSNSSFISVFAGRIADTGIDPCPFIEFAVEAAQVNKSLEVIWASPREIFNYVQAKRSQCHVITMTEGLISKLELLGKDLEQYSLETVRMFDEDARKSHYVI